MPIDPEQRQRLAAVMEERRLELRLTWQEVAERGDISLRALASARSGPGDIRPLTRRGIDKGLQWQEGRGVDNILAGETPLPAAAAVPQIVANSARAVGIDPSDLGDPWTSAVREAVAAAKRIHGDSPTGSQVFHDGPASASEAGVWDNRALSEESKIFAVAILRAMAARDQAGRNSSGRAGLTLVAAARR